MPQKVPQEAYDFSSHIKPPVSTHSPARDQNNSKVNHGHGGRPNVFGGSADVFGGSSGSGTPQVPQHATGFDNHDFANFPTYTHTQDQINTKIVSRKRNSQANRRISRITRL